MARMNSRGYIVALEGPEEIVSTQLELLPDFPHILKMPDMSQFLRDLRPRHGDSFSALDYTWRVKRMLEARYTDAGRFIAEGPPGQQRLVFMHGGAVTAAHACLAAIREFVPEVRDDVIRAQLYLTDIVKKGVYGARTSPGGTSEDAPQDTASRAMRAAEDLDATTANLQPDSFGQFIEDSSDSKTKGRKDNQEDETTSTTGDKYNLNVTAQAPMRFSTFSTSTTEDRNTTRLSTAEEGLFRQAKLVGVPVGECGRLVPTERDKSVLSLDSTGEPRLQAVTPDVPIEPNRHEALLMLRGEARSSMSFDPVLAVLEDLVVLFCKENSPAAPEEIAGEYRSAEFLSLAPGTSWKPTFQEEEKFLHLVSSKNLSDGALQKEFRSQLKSWFKKHEPTLNFSLLEPARDRNDLPEAVQAALTTIGQKTDLILAVGVHEGVRREICEGIVSDLLKLGQPDGKLSRSGRLDLNLLISQVMVAHTCRPLAQQTENPFANSSRLAELLLPHIAACLGSSAAPRFLALEFPHANFPVMLSLQELIGRKRCKIAAIVDHELSPLARNPTRLPSLSTADFVISSNATASEILSLKTKLWKVLVGVDEWYNHGKIKTARNNGEEKGPEGERTSIALTTERAMQTPTIPGRLNTVKRPLGYDVNKPKFHLPMVRARRDGPVSPPESVPASPDRPPPPLPPKAPPSSVVTSPASRHEPFPAPASPDPTISSATTGSSDSNWKAGLAKHRPRPTTPTTGGSGAATKLSALFRRPRENPAKGKNISPPVLQSSTNPLEALTPVKVAAQTVSPFLPSAPLQHVRGRAHAAEKADMELHDSDDEDSDAVNEDEKRLLGGIGERLRPGGAEKAKRVLGLQ